MPTSFIIVIFALVAVELPSAKVIIVNCTALQPSNFALESNTTYYIQNCSTSIELLHNNLTTGLDNVSIFVHGGTALPIIQILIGENVAAQNFVLHIDDVVGTIDHPSVPLLTVVGDSGGELRDSSIVLTNCNISVREPSANYNRRYYTMFGLVLAEVHNMSLDMQNSKISVTQTFALASVYIFAFVTTGVVDNVKINMFQSSTNVVGFLSVCATVSFDIGLGSTFTFSNIDIMFNRFESVVNGKNTNASILNTSASVIGFYSISRQNAIMNGSSRVAIKDCDVSLVATIDGSFLKVDRFQSLQGSLIVDIENVTANIVIVSLVGSDTSSSAVVNLGLEQSVESLRVHATNVFVTTFIMARDPPALTFIGEISALVSISTPTISNISIFVRGSSLQTTRNTTTEEAPLISNLYYLLTSNSHIVMFRKPANVCNVIVTLTDTTLTTSLSALLLPTTALLQAGYAHSSLILCAVDVLVDSIFTMTRCTLMSASQIKSGAQASPLSSSSILTASLTTLITLGNPFSRVSRQLRTLYPSMSVAPTLRHVSTLMDNCSLRVASPIIAMSIDIALVILPAEAIAVKMHIGNTTAGFDGGGGARCYAVLRCVVFALVPVKRIFGNYL